MTYEFHCIFFQASPDNPESISRHLFFWLKHFHHNNWLNKWKKLVVEKGDHVIFQIRDKPFLAMNRRWKKKFLEK